MLKSFEDAVMKVIGSIGDAFKGFINGIGNLFGFENLFATVSEIFTNFITFAKEKLTCLNGVN